MKLCVSYTNSVSDGDSDSVSDSHMISSLTLTSSDVVFDYNILTNSVPDFCIGSFFGSDFDSDSVSDHDYDR